MIMKFDEQNQSEFLEALKEKEQKEQQLLEKLELEYSIPADKQHIFYEIVNRLIILFNENRENLLESLAIRGNSWWFIPFIWIGSSGYIVTDAGQIQKLDSRNGYLIDIWAYIKGIDSNFNLGKLYIIKVNDYDLSIDIFKDFFSKSNLETLFSKDNKEISITINDNQIIPLLVEVEIANAFQFKFEVIDS